jgi:hypothetical protein
MDRLKWRGDIVSFLVRREEGKSTGVLAALNGMVTVLGGK